MHGRFDKRGNYRSDSNLRQNVGFGFLLLPVVIAIALITLIVAQPTASNWISEAVQAEFIGDTIPPGQSPTQLAQPAEEPHSATADWMITRADAAYRGQR
jgi:hypothetical protein